MSYSHAADGRVAPALQSGESLARAASVVLAVLVDPGHPPYGGRHTGRRAGRCGRWREVAPDHVDVLPEEICSRRVDERIVGVVQVVDDLSGRRVVVQLDLDDVTPHP